MGSRQRSLTGTEVAGDNGRVDARVDGGRVERNQPALAFAGHNHGLVALVAEPVDSREGLLNLVTDDGAADLPAHTPDPLAVRLIGHTQARIAGPRVLTVDQHRRQHLAATRGEQADQA